MKSLLFIFFLRNVSSKGLLDRAATRLMVVPFELKFSSGLRPRALEKAAYLWNICKSGLHNKRIPKPRHERKVDYRRFQLSMADPG
jgi:hypothetical protein